MKSVARLWNYLRKPRKLKFRNVADDAISPVGKVIVENEFDFNSLESRVEKVDWRSPRWYQRSEFQTCW